MTTLLTQLRFIVGALAIALAVTLAAPAGAQQVNPTASSVKEDQLFQQLDRITGRCTIPDQKACTSARCTGLPISM